MKYLNVESTDSKSSDILNKTLKLWYYFTLSTIHLSDKKQVTGEHMGLF
jgi:hypothetical protein